MPVSNPGPAELWPQQLLNVMDSPTVRIGGRTAPAGTSWDTNGYLKTLGTLASPFVPTIDKNGLAIAAPYSTADVPARTPERDQTGSQKLIGQNQDGSWYFEDLDIFGCPIKTVGGSSTLAADFNPGDTSLTLVNGTSFPASGAGWTVRLGSSAGESAAATLDGMAYQAQQPGAAGSAIRVRHVTGAVLAISRVGNDITIQYVPGSTSRSQVKTALDAATGAGLAGELIAAPSGGTTKLNIDVALTNLTGGADPGFEWNSYATKSGVVLSGLSGPSRKYEAGSQVRAEPVIHINNCRFSDPQVHGFDDSMAAVLSGDADLNALAGMASASLVLGAITFTSTKGEIGNARTIQYVDPRAVSQGETIYQATLTTPFGDPNANIVCCNKGDGGTQISVTLLGGAGTNALLVTVSGSDITVQLATTAGVITTTAAQLRDALNANGKVQAYLAAGSNGTAVVSAMTKRHLVEAEFVIRLSTNGAGAITSTASSVVATVNNDGRTTDYITAIGAGAAPLTEIARTPLTGGVGGTLNLRNVSAAFPNPTGGAARVYAQIGKWAVSYVSYVDDGAGTGHFTGVSPTVNQTAAGGWTQPVTDGDPVKPLFPYGQMSTASALFNSDACQLIMRNVWFHYSGGEPGISLGGDRHDIDKIYAEGLVQDTVKFGGAGGDTGHRIGSLTGGGIVLFAHPAVPHGKNAMTHFDNAQINYAYDCKFINCYVPVTRHAVLFANVGGAGDYPAAELRGLVFEDCAFDGSGPGNPAEGLSFRGGKSGLALPADGCGIRRCYFNLTQFIGASHGGLSWGTGYHINDVNEDNYYDDGTLFPGSIVTIPVPPPPVGELAANFVARASYSLEVAWDAYSTGIFTFDVSEFDGTDTLGVSPFDFRFTGENDDLSAMFDGGDVTRGEANAAVGGSAAAGSATFELRDPDGLCNPDNALSPLAGMLADRLHPVRLRSKFDDVWHGIYFGWVRRSVWEPQGRRGVSRLECVDLFWWLERAEPVITATGITTTGAAIGRILDAIGWTDPALRDLADGDTIPDFSSDGKKNALQLIRDLLETERGVFYINGDGVATYRDRASRALVGSVSISGFAAGTIQNTMRAISPGVDFENAVTRVTVNRTQTAFQAVAVDDDAQRKIGFSDLSIDTPYLLSDTQATDLATWLLSQLKTAQQPLYDLTIDNRDASLLDQILNREIGDRITVSAVRGNTLLDGYIDQLTHRITRTRHTGAWTLSRATIGTAFTFDVSEFDGEDVLVY